MKILITGGAGFVGSYLARAFKADAALQSVKVDILDNLHRRGSELNLAQFKKLGINFFHGDIRVASDFNVLEGPYDVLIEASAEPSVQAGYGHGLDYLWKTNLFGTINCLEFAKKNVKNFIYLSTSRVYSIQSLRDLPIKATDSRFVCENLEGVDENFSTQSPRSFYGTSKLASEKIILEYAHEYNFNAVINRCGVIAGPGQFGKVDQGVFTMWVAHHYFKKELTYMGFNGSGKQVRDLLHPMDLFTLIKKQLSGTKDVTGKIFNVGGGIQNSLSLLELTRLSQEVTGNNVNISKINETSAVDIPYYVSDNRKIELATSWKPEQSTKNIIRDIFTWIEKNEKELKNLFS